MQFSAKFASLLLPERESEGEDFVELFAKGGGKGAVPYSVDEDEAAAAVFWSRLSKISSLKRKLIVETSMGISLSGRWSITFRN